MDLVQLIAQVGFPMAVAVFLLVRLDARLEKLTAAIDELTGELKNGKGEAK